jgi:hypothetical protein
MGKSGGETAEIRLDRVLGMLAVQVSSLVLNKGRGAREQNADPPLASSQR